MEMITMSLERQIGIVILCYLLSFLSIRWFLWGIKLYMLNTSARKKRKKGETFKEWFLYSRYREEIPRIFLVLYFVIVLIHPLALIICIICSYIKPLEWVGSDLSMGILIFDFLWNLAIQLLFWQAGPRLKYDRWIKKKRSKRKK